MYGSTCRSWWPCGLKRGSAAARLLGLRVWVPQGSWMSVSCECCVLSGRGLCGGLITRPEESYRVCCVWVWSWSLEKWGGLGPQGAVELLGGGFSFLSWVLMAWFSVHPGIFINCIVIPVRISVQCGRELRVCCVREASAHTKVRANLDQLPRQKFVSVFWPCMNMSYCLNFYVCNNIHLLLTIIIINV
jgi:hypothetical protein